MHERGLSAAGRSDDGNKFADLNVEIHVVECTDFLTTKMVDFADAAQFDESHFGW